MNLEQLQNTYVSEFDIHQAAKALDDSSSDKRVLFHLKDLDNMTRVVMKFELLRWVVLPIVGIVAYYLSLHVFQGGFMLQMMVYIMGMCVLGFGFLSYLVNSNKASNAAHAATIAAMLAYRQHVDK